MKFNSVFFILHIVIFASIGSLHPESESESPTLYLPFPDLPKEILNPEMDLNIVQQEKENTNQKIPIKPSQPILPDLPKETTTSKQEKQSPFRNSEGLNKDIHPQRKNSGKAQEKPQLDAEPSEKPISNPQKPTITKVSTKEKPQEFSFEEFEKFQKEMERIRSKEKENPEAALLEYKSLLKLYNQPRETSIILISMAWNHYQRGDYKNSLDVCIRILEDENLIHEKEYPTAFYIAYQIHGKPWEGKNLDFQKKYKSIFLKNAMQGRQNFESSFYKDFFLKD